MAPCQSGIIEFYLGKTPSDMLLGFKDCGNALSRVNLRVISSSKLFLLESLYKIDAFPTSVLFPGGNKELGRIELKFNFQCETEKSYFNRRKLEPTLTSSNSNRSSTLKAFQYTWLFFLFESYLLYESIFQHFRVL